MDRASLVERTRFRLERSTYPRLELSGMVVLSGLFAFLVSFALLRAGVDSMPVRYGLAGLSGYGAFLGLIRLWISWKRTRQRAIEEDDGVSLVDLVDVPLDLPRGGGPSAFGGGRSGGGGATESWMDGRSGGSGGASWIDDPGDSLGLIILLLLAAVGSLATIGYVVYSAPALLAEVLVDAVIVAAISKHVASKDRPDWTTTLLRRTWLPAVTLLALLIIAGWALQRLAPEARSIGPAIEAIRR